MCPLIKKFREDILRPDEVKVYLAMAKHSPRTVRDRGLIAFLYGYGKRISEIIVLDKSDVQVNEDKIITKFHVLKSRPRAGILKIVNKELALDHWLAPYIVGLVNDIDGGFLFPSHSARGHLTRQGALWLLQHRYNDDIWPHLFRHSLAGLMAENGATVPELMAWFDWENEGTAMGYVRGFGPTQERMARKWSKRRF
jgi:integrase/recombinase XerD